MDNKEVFYTDESGVRDWESGEVFYATPIKSYRDHIRFIVSSQYVIESLSDYVVIDTGNDADL